MNGVAPNRGGMKSAGACWIVIGFIVSTGCMYTVGVDCKKNCCTDADCRGGKACSYGNCVCAAGLADCGTGVCVSPPCPIGASGCDIDSTGYPSGAANSANACQSCQPSVTTSSWTVLADGSNCGPGKVCFAGSCSTGCWIASASVATDVKNSDGCQSCQPNANTLDWTSFADGTPCGTNQLCNGGVCSSGCWINSTYYASGKTDPLNTCESCQPGKSAIAWTPITPCPISVVQASPTKGDLYDYGLNLTLSQPAAGNNIIVGVAGEGCGVPAGMSVSDSQGIAYQIVPTCAAPTAESQTTNLCIFYRSSVSAHAGPLTVNVAANCDCIAAQALEVSGLVSTSPVDVQKTYLAAEGAVSLAFATGAPMAQANELAVSLMSMGNDSLSYYTVARSPVDWVVDGIDETEVLFVFAHNVANAATVPALTWTFNSSGYDVAGELVVTFKGQ